MQALSLICLAILGVGWVRTPDRSASDGTIRERAAKAPRVATALPSRPDSVPAAGFPDAWEGRWHGPLEVQRGTGVLQAVGMSLEILPFDSAGCYTWQLAYDGMGSADVRPYVICPADSQGVAWRIDERNGIVLDAVVLGTGLYSRFEVLGNLLLTRDELRGDTLFHEIVSGRLSPKLTGDTVLASGDSIPPVGSYPLGTRQVARLVRVEDAE